VALLSDKIRKETVMRKFIIICLLSLPVCALAQYHPFVSEGKVWIGDVGGTFPYMLIMKGDTLIADKGYKKMYEKNWFFHQDHVFHYLAAFRETEGKVFVVHPGSDQEFVLYDLEMEEGETWVWLDNPWTGFTMRYRADMSEEIIRNSYFGKRYNYTGGDRVGVLTTSKTSSPGSWISNVIFIEGIGPTNGIPYIDEKNKVYFGERAVRVMLEDGDVTIKSRHMTALYNVFYDYYQGKVDADGVLSNDKEEATAFDLYGRKLEGVLQHGVYIRNGKKYIK
jgi:hypothetical protein